MYPSLFSNSTGTFAREHLKEVVFLFLSLFFLLLFLHHLRLQQRPLSFLLLLSSSPSLQRSLLHHQYSKFNLPSCFDLSLEKELARDAFYMVLHFLLSHMILPHQAGIPYYRTDHLIPITYKSYRKWSCMKRQHTLLPSHSCHRYGDGVAPRVFVISDLHTDYPENMMWVERMSAVRYTGDILLVAGDVAETYKNFVLTMTLLKERFKRIFYVPGNHDLWCRTDGENYVDSIEKLHVLLDTCRELGVETSPAIVNNLGIIPLFSWYHESFDKEKDIDDIRIPSLEMVCKDFHACKWPQGLSCKDVVLAQYFDALNEKNLDSIKQIQRRSSQIITFSHFLPRPELCPEKRMLFYPNLPKIIGSDSLEARLRSIHGNDGSSTACHVFGHTHFCWDAVLDGIRYIQAPLAYPRERKRRMNGGEDWLPFCIYYDGHLGDMLSPCYWSDYYSKNKREPENVELAPWVTRFYSR